MFGRVAIVAVALLLCGCGGRHDTGRAIFAASCAGCHSLTGHDTRASGGDLAIATRSVAAIASFTRVMPVRLSAAQVRAVAVYVHAAAAKLRR